MPTSPSERSDTSSLHAFSVAQLCPTLCDPVNCSPPGSFVHGIFQARILGAVSSSRWSSWPRNRTHVSCLSRRILYHCTPGNERSDNLVAQRLKHLPAMRETRLRTLGHKDPLEKWQPTPVFLPGESHGGRSLIGYSPWGSRRVGHDWTTLLSFSFFYPHVHWCTKIILYLWKPLMKVAKRGFPGYPMVKTLHFQCRGPGFNPWLGN